MEKVIVERDSNGVVWATINRLEKRNAIDFDVMDHLKAVIEETTHNKDDKMLVITGTGNQAFCSGGDLSVFHDLHTEEDAYKMLSKMGGILYDLLTLPKPTVALLNGTAIGGGCELATACDYRIASKGAKFGFVQGKLAITTGWGGATMLMEKMNPGQALEILMTAKRYTAIEGKDFGFIHQVYEEDELVEQTNQWMSSFLEQGSGVLKAYKQTLIRKWESTNIRRRMFEEIGQCSVLWESDEHHDAVKSFLNKK